ncbi:MULTISPECIES: hypothetical protein [unclassified Wolbachia]|uniref:hypothetical protein n=1 Tax=unclassified Wolbachia TaxID=2640676 RepID=UPI00222EDB1E|nr:hypothetical protein [Wolbachia endosymbiont (group A) of Philonthus cognatus]
MLNAMAGFASNIKVSSQCLTLGWLCCIASYDGLKIKKVENISSLLFWYLQQERSVNT